MQNLNIGIGFTLLLLQPSQIAIGSLSAWMRLKPQFMGVCGLCSTITTTKESVS
jgi:hypothetical protein